MSKAILSIILSGLLSSLLLAQKPNFKFKSIDQSHGLANGTVQAIFEDSFGLIWLGTQAGVQQFDGKTFKAFTYSEKDSSGLSQNYINAFCEDAHNNIWIATGGGLNKYNRETDKVERYRWNDPGIAANGEPFLSTLISDSGNKNILWITAMGVGLIKIDISTDSTTIYPVNISNDRAFVWMQAHPLEANKLLMGSTSLLCFDKGSGTFSELFKLEQNEDVHKNIINAAAPDPKFKEIIWLATGDPWGRGKRGGLIRYDLIKMSSEIFSIETRPGEIYHNSMMSLSFHENNLWIGSRMRGALLYQLDSDRFYYYQKNEYYEGSFVTGHAVRSILSDRSGCCWFGTWGDGISVLSPSAQKFTHYKHLPGHDNELPGNYVSSFAEDKDGNIWIGTQDSGLSKFDPKTNTFENFFTDFKGEVGESTMITSLFYDSYQKLWIGTYNDAIYRIDPVTGERHHYQKGNGRNNVSQKRITAITELKPGEILISTYGGGLNIYNYETQSFLQFLHDPEDSNSIPDNQVWKPIEGIDGNYYFCGNSTAGLIQFNPFSQTFRHLNTAYFSTFNAPLKVSESEVYIDDVSMGLCKMVLGEEIKVEQVYDKHGNRITNIESLLADDNGVLWIATGNGLVSFDPKTRDTKRYSADDGLQSHIFSRLAGLKASDGKMYFGGKNGFSAFHPDKISLSQYQPPIIFTSFKLFQENVPIGNDSPLKKSLLLMDQIILEHHQNDFTLSFAALDYSNPEEIIYKYMLENHDNDWILSGNNNEASYTNMDPGNYTLKVMATNSDGVWNENTQQIIIVINPPWWRTKWAYLAYVLIFIAGVILIDRIQRRRLLEKEKAQAREKELEQAKEIEKAYTHLKATQEQLLHSEKMASLGELTAGIAHEIQNPLNFVNNFSEVNRELIAELKEEIIKGDHEEVNAIINDIERNENKITHHGKRADGIVKGMLLHSRTDAGQKEPTNVNMLADEYLRLSYHGLRAKNKSFNAEFVTDFDKSIPSLNIVPQDVGRVLLNLINNAFQAVAEKQAQGVDGYKPHVSVSSSTESDHVVIRVKDNGNGISTEVMDKIFQPFFTTKEAGEGTGLGLSLSYDIITKGHGGELKVETKENEGAEFIIRLPLHLNK